jgi:putative membrane protein
VAEEKPAPAEDQLQLAVERTLAAYERTLLAWIRTAASLITFGFALYQFFEHFDQQDPHRVRNQLLSARTFGVLMIVVGIAALALATLQYRRVLKRLDAWVPQAPFSFALLLAALISLLGILALLEAGFRHL